MDLKKSGNKAKENDYHLAGKWKGKCINNETRQRPFYKKNLQFSIVGDFESTTTFFNDEGCIDKIVSHVESGTYSSLGESKTDQGSREINFLILKSSITPELQSTASDFNTRSFCGLDKWKNRKSKNIFDATCDGVVRKKGDVIYNTYRFSNSHKKLALGKEPIFLNGEGIAERPEKTDEGIDYDKE